MNDLFWISILIIFIILLLGNLFFLWQGRRTTARNMKLAGEKLSEILDMDTDEKVMIFTEDENLISLISQVNRMLEERQKMKADYRRSLNDSRRMLSNISHDIKTPLTVVLGYLEIMRLNNEINPDMIRKSEKKAKQVMELMNSFFTLSKIEAGDTNIDISRIQMNEICRRNVIDFYEILTEQDFQVEIMIPEEPVYAYGNEDAIDRILTNLISNAVRYGRDGKYLGIRLYKEGEFIFVDVTDKGKGIDPIAADHVFDRLYTMEDSRNKEIQGNGLGLAIAKSLAEKLEGDIILESQPYKDTTFRLRLRSTHF